ncbi:MAG: hypothetical protein ABI068_07420 [Ktedonobacterales bacterium]
MSAPVSMSRKIIRFRPSQPPSVDQLPLVNADPEVAHWLDHYWRKLKLPPDQAHYLAVTDDRQEFARWTGRRLNPMALGCYCYLPIQQDANESDAPHFANAATLTAPTGARRRQLALPGFEAEECDMVAYPPDDADDAPLAPSDFRHLIFVEPELLPEGIEVTVAHELIHLADRVQGRPRKHHCHGHDAISVDEAAITERDPDWLRELLAEETRRREGALRKARPYKYIYDCPNCRKEYPRVKRYARSVSCGHCDSHFNPAFVLRMRLIEHSERTEHTEQSDHAEQPAPVREVVGVTC